MADHHRHHHNNNNNTLKDSDDDVEVISGNMSPVAHTGDDGDSSVSHLPPLQSNMRNNYANYLLLQRVVQERKAERDALTAKRIEAYEVSTLNRVCSC